MGTLAGWSKRQKLTIDHTQVDDELTDFPVKVIVSSDNPLFDTAKSDGSDVRFTAADGETLLKFEREVHDTTEKIAVYHVKIPSVSATSDTVFYLYYGNPNASDASSPNDVWDSNYKLVMHMGPSLEDSTSNGNDGTNYGTTLGLASDGYYRSFDGVDDYISLPIILPDNGSIHSLYKPIGSWYNYNTLWDNSIYLDYWECWIYADGRLKSRGSFSIIGGAGVEYDLDNLSGPNTLYDVVYTWEKTGNQKLYIDGILRDSAAMVWASPGDTVYICGGNPGNTKGKGICSEFRISSIARSDAWIKATSASLHDELLTFGSEEPAVTMMLAFNF